MRVLTLVTVALVLCLLFLPLAYAEAAPKKSWFCAEPWGWVSADGSIVAADVGRNASGEVTLGKAIVKLHPAYPATARAARATGRVVIEAKVGKDGLVESVEVRFGARTDLDQASLHAAEGWRFVAATLDGKAVPAYAQIVFDYCAEPCRQ